MLKGGYHILDLHNTPFTTDNSSDINIPGIYESIEGSYGKPILLSGYMFDAVEYGDIYVMPQLSSDNSYTIAGIYNNKTLIIEQNDNVTVATSG